MFLSPPAPPSLAILDWKMPHYNGIEVCRRVRQHLDRPYTYLILLTSLSEKEHISTGLEAGADEYVIKPFSPRELRARLAVGQRRHTAGENAGKPDRRARENIVRRAEAKNSLAHLHVLQTNP